MVEILISGGSGFRQWLNPPIQTIPLDTVAQTPKYSWILSMLASSRWFGIMSITWPCSMT
jgi:hypothetical protein